MINDEETFLAFTTQLNGQVANGANTNTIELNSVTFEYKVFLISQINYFREILKLIDYN